MASDAIRRLACDAVDLWCVELPALQAAAPPDVLSDEEARRAARLRVPKVRLRYCAAHVALRTILADYVHVRPADVVIRTAEAGKPRLDERRHPGGPCFSLSHAGDLALVAVARCAVGVDIEHEREDLAPDGIVARYFSESEAQDYFALPPALRRPAFLAAWTLKEAYLKATGEGLRRPLNSFSVTIAPDAPPRLAFPPDAPADERRWQLVRLSPAPGYCGALAYALA
jgi:4'-phosphopantetheinyl transferase